MLFFGSRYAGSETVVIVDAAVVACDVAPDAGAGVVDAGAEGVADLTVAGGVPGVLLQAPKSIARLATRAADLLLITGVSFEWASSRLWFLRPL